MKSKAVTDEEYETLAAFRYELRRFLHFSEAAAETVGLTPQQHQALLAIRGFRGPGVMTVGELAERLQIKHHSAVGLANRLAKQGLIARQTSPDDRRQVLLSLTAHGDDLLAELTAAHKAEVRRMHVTLRELLENFG
ncbi:MAG: MarR family transcriptional regulator [Anaerolineae bacterium]|nr:MarR family transcriptional regulator [Anaerolineae bacterium]HNS40414.1 MarR family transcriptional regulator [Promineifilum sp.]